MKTYTDLSNVSVEKLASRKAAVPHDVILELGHQFASPFKTAAVPALAIMSVPEIKSFGYISL